MEMRPSDISSVHASSIAEMEKLPSILAEKHAALVKATAEYGAFLAEARETTAKARSARSFFSYWQSACPSMVDAYDEAAEACLPFATEIAMGTNALWASSAAWSASLKKHKKA